MIYLVKFLIDTNDTPTKMNRHFTVNTCFHLINTNFLKNIKNIKNYKIYLNKFRCKIKLSLWF